MEEEPILFPLFKMISCFLATVFISTCFAFTPYDLRLDYRASSTVDDLVLYTPSPKFTWKLPVIVKKQDAYQLQIQSELKDRWDSGWIRTNDADHRFSNEKNGFQPWTRYWFRLRVSSENQTSAWTEWIRFRTVTCHLHQYLMEMNDRVFWIGSNQIGMNELRKEFQLDSKSTIRTAIVLISGIGYYELLINGRAVDPTRKLDPAWTTYERRTLFVTFDVTSFVQVMPMNTPSSILLFD